MKLCLTNLTQLTIVVKHKLTTFDKHKLTTFVKHLTIIVKHWLTIFRQQLAAKYVIPISSKPVNRMVVLAMAIKGPMAKSAQVKPLLKSL